MRMLPPPRQGVALNQQYIVAVVVFVAFSGQERRGGEHTV